MQNRSLLISILIKWIVLFVGIHCDPVMYPDDRGAGFSPSPFWTENVSVTKSSTSGDKSTNPPVTTKRDVWELVASASDIISLRSGNGSHFESSNLSVQMRLHKLEYYFNTLRIPDEDCRQRLLCEISKEPAKYSPLSTAFLDETSFNGDENLLASRLLASKDGARLLTYIEASQRGLQRHGCEVWAYRCPVTTMSMINYKSLLLWREMSKWLTVKMVANKRN